MTKYFACCPVKCRSTQRRAQEISISAAGNDVLSENSSVQLGSFQALVQHSRSGGDGLEGAAR